MILIAVTLTAILHMNIAAFKTESCINSMQYMA